MQNLKTVTKLAKTLNPYHFPCSSQNLFKKRVFYITVNISDISQNYCNYENSPQTNRHNIYDCCRKLQQCKAYPSLFEHQLTYSGINLHKQRFPLQSADRMKGQQACIQHNPYLSSF